jgi:ketosteroid isomerase-like protein
MSQENVKIIRRGYVMFGEGDVSGVAELFAPDAEVADGGGLGMAGTAAGTRFGPEGYLRSAEEAAEAFADYRVDAKDFIDAGETVIVPVRISGRGRVSGAPLEMHLVHSWVVRDDGKISRGEVYRTVDEALEAVGRSE